MSQICTADDLLKRAQQLGLPPQREGLAALLTLALGRWPTTEAVLADLHDLAAETAEAAEIAEVVA
jgi:hypothetical protein